MFDFLKAIILAGAALGCAVHGFARDYVITDYGVQQGDSTLLQTSAIQAVIDRAEADGGGRVVVPQGTYLTGALFFKPGTKLHLEKDATLKGSDEIENFRVWRAAASTIMPPLSMPTTSTVSQSPAAAPSTATA